LIRCIIIDDEFGAIDILTRYVEQTPNLQLLSSFRDSMEALSFIKENEVDLIFLDIEMPTLNGVQLSKLIQGKNSKIIFCTAYSEFAVDSYDLNAVDYLLKPIPFDRFLKAVEKVEPPSNKTELLPMTKTAPSSKIFIKGGSKIHQLDTKELLYMEKDGHYIIFHTLTNKIMSRMNMSELLKALPGKNFVRTHKSYVIAIDKIETIEKYSVYINKKDIPIGDSFKKDFFEKIKYAGK